MAAAASDAFFLSDSETRRIGPRWEFQGARHVRRTFFVCLYCMSRLFSRYHEPHQFYPWKRLEHMLRRTHARNKLFRAGRELIPPRHFRALTTQLRLQDPAGTPVIFSPPSPKIKIKMTPPHPRSLSLARQHPHGGAHDVRGPHSKKVAPSPHQAARRSAGTTYRRPSPLLLHGAPQRIRTVSRRGGRGPQKYEVCGTSFGHGAWGMGVGVPSCPLRRTAGKRKKIGAAALTLDGPLLIGRGVPIGDRSRCGTGRPLRCRTWGCGRPGEYQVPAGLGILLDAATLRGT